MSPLLLLLYLRKFFLILFELNNKRMQINNLRKLDSLTEEKTMQKYHMQKFLILLFLKEIGFKVKTKEKTPIKVL